MKSAINLGNSKNLKNQLRCQRRLLKKVSSRNNKETDSAFIEVIKQKIKDIENDIADQQRILKERKNAERYRKVKFFDRITLGRLEKKIRSKLKESYENNNLDRIKVLEDELEQVGNDQIYVAYFPNDTKYLSLFTRNGKRINDDEKTRIKREHIYSRISNTVDKSKITKKWVTAHKQVPNLKTNEALSLTKSNEDTIEKNIDLDERFQQDERFANLDHVIGVANTNEFSDDSDSKSSESKSNNQHEKKSLKSHSSSCNISEKTNSYQELSLQESSSVYSEESLEKSSSSSSSSSSSGRGDVQLDSSQEEKDDFFADSSTEAVEHMFKNSKTKVFEESRGKDKGYSTQSQPPGYFKKKRQRVKY